MTHPQSHVSLTLLIAATFLASQDNTFGQRTSSPPANSTPHVIELSLSSCAPGVEDMVVGSDDALYGVTTTGGRFSAGCIFRLSLDAFSRPQKGNYKGAPNLPQPNDCTVVHAFSSPQDEAHPTMAKSIIAGRDGNFYVNDYTNQAVRYVRKTDKVENLKNVPELQHDEAPIFNFGRCFAVGADGILWCLTPTGVVFHTRGDGNDFGALDATKDWKTAALNEDGYVYGTTLDSVMRIKQDGTDLSVLHKFAGTDNSTTEPVGPPVIVHGGAIFGYAHADESITGTDMLAANKKRGVLYEVNRDGSKFQVVSGFNYDPDGVLAVDGKWIYGVSDKGFFRFSSDRPQITLLLPSKERQIPKAIVIHKQSAYILNERSSIFQISLPSGDAAEPTPR
jgi:hypothetical protein